MYPGIRFAEWQVWQLNSYTSYGSERNEDTYRANSKNNLPHLPHLSKDEGVLVMAEQTSSAIHKRQMDTYHFLEEFYVGEELFDAIPEPVGTLVCLGVIRADGDLSRAETYFELARGEALRRWKSSERKGPP